MKKQERPKKPRREPRRGYQKPRIATTEAFESASADCSKGPSPTVS